MSDFDVNAFLNARQEEDQQVESGSNILPVQRSFTPKGSLFGALMRQENTVGSFFTNRQRSFWGEYKENDPNFKWTDHIPGGYLDYADRFAGAMNTDEINDIRFNIDLENRDKQIIAGKPIESIFTGFIVNALDPVNLLPGTAIFKGAKANVSAARATLNTGSAAFVSTVAQETALRQSQYDRSMAESSLNLVASTFLGTIIGGASGAYLHSPAGKKVTSDIAKVMDDGQIAPNAKVGDTVSSTISEGESVGAAFHAERTLEGEGLAMSPLAEKAYAKSLAKLSPLSRGLTSPFKSVRSTISDLLEVNLFQRKNSADMGYQETKHALETQIKKSRMEGDKALADYEDIFYSMNGFKQGEKGRSVKHFLDRNKVISWDEFEQGAYLAIIRNSHENPQLQKAGFLIRDRIFEPWKEKMIEIGELPPNVEVKTALGYFTRLYNIDKINDPRYFGSFENDDPDTIYTIVKRHVLNTNDQLKEHLPEIEKTLKQIKTLAKKERRIKSLSRELERLKKRAPQDRERVGQVLLKKEKEAEIEKQKLFDELVKKHKLSEQEIKELQEELAAEFNTIETIADMEGQGFHAEDLSKFQDLERQLEHATAKKEVSISQIEKQLAQAEADLTAEIEHIKSLKEKPEEEITYLPDRKARKKNLSEVKAKHEKKINILKERLKNTDKLENKNIEHAKEKVESFTSGFSKEKLIAYLNVVSIDERIKAARNLQEIEAKYQDKSVNEKLAAIQKYLESESNRLGQNEKKMLKIEEILEEPGAKDTTKQIQALEKELQEKYPPQLFTSKGQVRKLLETDLEAKTTIENIIDNIRGLNDSRYNNPFLSRVLGGAPSSTKNRHFLIPDEEIAPFLVTSPSKVAPKFLRGVVSHYHLTKWARENGFDTTTEAIKGRMDQAMVEYKEQLREAVKPEIKKRLQEEFEPRLAEVADKIDPNRWTPEYRAIQQEYLEALKANADPKYAAHLTDKFREGESDIRDSMSALLGIYGQGENIMDNKVAKYAGYMTGWNYLRMMGYMVVSSLTDPGSIVAKNGIGRFVHEGLKPIVSSFEAAKHNKQLLRDFMRGMESYKGHRLKSFADQEGLIQETGLFGKAFHYATEGFNNLSLMSYWTDMMQYITGNVSISRTLRAIDGYVSGAPIEKEVTRVVNLGISTNEFKYIHDQWKAHGGVEDGSYFINWGNWDTNSANGLKTLDSFKLALLKDIDSTIIMPTIGDKPLFAKTALGSILFQFKSFAFAATNKILISGLQRRDAEFAQGVISLLALGELSYITSRLLKNQPIDEDPAHLAYEALDRSGLMGILMEVPLTLQKVGLLPGGGTSRYSSRGWLGALGGPTLGTIEDITYLLNRFKNADETPLTDKDTDKILKLMPGNNIFYLDGINRNLGLTKSLAHSLGAEETE